MIHTVKGFGVVNKVGPSWGGLISLGHLPTNPDTCPTVGSARSDRLGSPVKQPGPTRGGPPITATQSSSLPALSTLPQAWPSTSSRRLAVDAAAPSLPGHSGKLSRGRWALPRGSQASPLPGPGLLPPQPELRRPPSHQPYPLPTRQYLHRLLFWGSAE